MLAVFGGEVIDGVKVDVDADEVDELTGPRSNPMAFAALSISTGSARVSSHVAAHLMAADSRLSPFPRRSRWRSTGCFPMASPISRARSMAASVASSPEISTMSRGIAGLAK